jgi:DUF4097 and DUF4098 domain-containing protein YvlB
MNSLQRVIKYCAIGLAIVLAIGIISTIVNIVVGIVSISSGRTWKGNLLNIRHRYETEDVKTVDFSDTFNGVKSLRIDNSAGELNIKIGDTFQVEARNVIDGFEASVNKHGELSINDNNSDISIFGFHLRGVNNPNAKITVYLPESFVAEEARIDTGAGVVNIDALNAEYLDISAGAGNIKGRNLRANKVKLEGGVGQVSLEQVKFNDANINCGVGNLYIQGELTGDSKCDCGVGEVRLELVGDVNDYDLDLDSGIGTVRVNGSRIREDNERNPSAANSIEIDGGIGNVIINFEQ